MIDFFKYLKGYLWICVTGFSPERFMNLCSNREILLWNICKEQDTYYMCISIGGFYKLRPIVKKTGTKVAIVKRCGLPFFMSEIFKRKLFLLGFIAAIFFLVWTSGYIWEIEISGNFTITGDIITDYLEEKNIRVGTKKNQLDIEKLEKDIRKEFYQITWTSVKLEGTKLTVEIKENDKIEFEKNYKFEQNSDELSSDLVAQNDGKIVSMIVRKGVPMVSIGQEVKKGDLLVSGKIPVFSEDGTIRKYNYCEADADIMLEHSLNISETLSTLYKKKNYTGREKEKNILNAFGKNIDFFGKKNPFLSYDIVYKEKKLKIMNDFYLPIKWGRYTYREYYVIEGKYTEEEAKKILKEKYKKIILTLTEKGVQIIGKDVKIERNNSEWVLRGVLQVCEKAGISVSISEEEFHNSEPE